MYQDWTPTEADRLLSQLARHSPDIIWMFSPDWSELKFIDDAYEDIWGRSIETLAENPTDFLNGVHPEDRERVTDHMERLSNGEPIEVEFRVNADEEYRRHVWAEGEPIYDDGAFVAVAGFVRDVTERTRYKRKLERKNDRLEEFASIVSHDLRNPLNVADGQLELAKAECDSTHLSEVEWALDRMGTLIENLLLLAREGKAVQRMESVDLATISQDCWRNVRADGATLVTDTDRWIRADETRLQQLLENLMRNAVEHAESEVTVRVGELEDGFYCQDTGPGIPEDERADVFERGYSTTTDGTGFGLSIVAAIVAAHGWDVSLTDGEDGGARFEIRDVTFADSAE